MRVVVCRDVKVNLRLRSERAAVHAAMGSQNDCEAPLRTKKSTKYSGIDLPPARAVRALAAIERKK